MQHSCQNRVEPAFFADPAVRLHVVLDALPDHDELGICGDDLDQPPDFTHALARLGAAVAVPRTGCIDPPLTNPAAPDCVVEDVTTALTAARRSTSCRAATTPPAPRPAGASSPPPDTVVRVACATTAQ